ncbi:putative sphingolipid C4-monooxygenase [Arabidopsis thaliana]
MEMQQTTTQDSSPSLGGLLRNEPLSHQDSECFTTNSMELNRNFSQPFFVMWDQSLISLPTCLYSLDEREQADALRQCPTKEFKDE